MSAQDGNKHNKYTLDLIPMLVILVLQAPTRDVKGYKCAISERKLSGVRPSSSSNNFSSRVKKAWSVVWRSGGKFQTFIMCCGPTKEDLLVTPAKEGKKATILYFKQWSHYVRLCDSCTVTEQIQENFLLQGEESKYLCDVDGEAKNWKKMKRKMMWLTRLDWSYLEFYTQGISKCQPSRPTSQPSHPSKDQTKWVLITDQKSYRIKKFNIPLGNKLFFLVHVIFGIGLPVAEHSNRTGDPFFTCKWPPDVTWFIFGGTELIAQCYGGEGKEKKLKWNIKLKWKT